MVNFKIVLLALFAVDLLEMQTLAFSGHTRLFVITQIIHRGTLPAVLVPVIVNDAVFDFFADLHALPVVEIIMAFALLTNVF